MFSKSVTYRLKAAICLARHTDEKTLFKLDRVVTETGISAPILASVMQKLAKKGIISSRKGRNGGFYMTPTQKDRVITEIIPEIGQISMLSGACLLGRERCVEQSDCPYKELVSRVRDDLGTLYTNTTLREISNSIYNTSKKNKIT